MQPRRAFLISFSEKYALLLLNTIGTMTLARLLTPEQIGVYAVGAVLVGLAQSVRDFGIGPYVIQEKQLTPEKLRAALGAAILVAWTLALLVLLASVPAAIFYRDARVGTVMRLLALNFLLVPFSALALPLLRRQLRFATILLINLVGSLSQLLVSVLLAWRGEGFLSLAWGAVAGTVGALLVCGWCWPSGLPYWPTWRGMKSVLTFGSLSTTGSVIDELGVAAPDLIVGKLIGVGEVGILGKAQGIINVFNQLVTSAISPVIFPLFAAQARAGGDLRWAFLTTVRYLTVLAWPFFGFVAMAAPALVRLLYGERWDACVPLIRIICLASAIYSIFSMARYLLVAIGAVARLTQLDAVAVLVRVSALMVAAPFGLVGVAWAVVGGAVFRSLYTYYVLRRQLELRASGLVAALWRSAIVAALSLVGPALLLLRHPWGQVAQLCELVLAAATALAAWLLAIVLLRHELAPECRALAHKVRASLSR